MRNNFTSSIVNVVDPHSFQENRRRQQQSWKVFLLRFEPLTDHFQNQSFFLNDEKALYSCVIILYMSNLYEKDYYVSANTGDFDVLMLLFYIRCIVSWWHIPQKRKILRCREFSTKVNSQKELKLTSLLITFLISQIWKTKCC